MFRFRRNPGPPLSVVFSVSDIDDGLQAIDVLAANNAEVNIPGFSVGDNGPILVTATRTNPYDDMQVSVSVSDTRDASSQCDYSIVAVDDPTPPDCSIESTSPGPPSQVFFTIQDNESGLESVSVVEKQNATVVIDSFAPGITAPISVTVTQVNTNLPFSVVLESTNLQNKSSICRYPVISYDINRPEFDSVGDDSQNFFLDPLMDRIVDFSRNQSNFKINQDSDFSL